MIESGSRRDIEDFPLYNEDNQGDDILVSRDAVGKVNGYVQYTDNQIYFVETADSAKGTGVGRKLIDELKQNNDVLYAINVVPSARGFYEKLGFSNMNLPGGLSGDSYYGDFVWYQE